jgi:hypothetical protein
MVRGKRWFGALFALTVVAATAVRPAEAQVAAVGVRSLDRLIGDIKYIAGLVGQAQVGEAIDGQINQATGGKGLAGIGLDTKKPLGVFVNLPANYSGGIPPMIAAIPVTDAKALFDFAAGLGVPLQDQDGFKVIESPTGPVYLKAVGGYIFGSNDKTVFDGKLPDPAGLIPASQPNASVGVVLNFDRVPAPLKQQVLALLDQLGSQAAQNLPEGPLRAIQELAAKSSIEQYKDLFNDGRELALGLEVNTQRGLLAAEISLTAAPGSRTAGRIAAYSDPRSIFTPLTKGAAGFLVGSMKIPQPDLVTFSALWAGLTEKALEAAKNDNARRALSTLFKGLEASVDRQVIDLGVSAQVGADKKMGIVGGMRLADGRALEAAFRAAIKEVPVGKGVDIKLDADTHAGTAIHEFRPTAGDADFNRVFGEAVIYVAFPRSAVLISVGRSGKALIKQGIDGSLNPPSPIPASAFFELSLSKIAEIAPEGDPATAALRGLDPTRDKLRMIMRGGEAMRARFEMDAAIIKAFAALRSN